MTPLNRKINKPKRSALIAFFMWLLEDSHRLSGRLRPLRASGLIRPFGCYRAQLPYRLVVNSYFNRGAQCPLGGFLRDPAG